MPPEAPTIPPVDVSALPIDTPARAEESAFANPGAKLDHGLRRVAGVFALLFAAVFYIAGLVAALHFAGISSNLFDGSWHIVTSVLVALFSVPTVLVLAVFRGTGMAKKDSEMESLHAAVGSRLMSLVEKLLDKAVK
jgi:hypothetical protein